MNDIWWQTIGEGDCHLVLLHGWGLNAQVWDCITPQLAGHGGRVSLMEITDDGLAILQFGGGCNGCSMVDVDVYKRQIWACA